MRVFNKLNREAIIWLVALVWLGLNARFGGIGLCPLDALGFNHCPGCGIGHSIGLALRGDVSASWSAHPLGIPALAVLLNRILLLTFPSLKFFPKTLQL